jgi:sialic acid synthase SpsE
LLRLAAEAGADAVKFQSYTAERLTSANDTARLERVRRFALDEAAHRRLAEEAAALDIAFISTAVTEDWIPLLTELAPALKIASGDLTFEPLIRAAAAAGKPLILSTGLGTVEEVDQAVAWIRDETGETDLAERLVLLHCVSAYPTPAEDANLLSVPFMAERYGLPTGYSNHVVGIDACLAAVALGACVIETHFTDCKTGRDFHDHALSAEPDDMRELVQRVAGVRASRGRWGKFRQSSELPLLDAVRKGVVAARELPAGQRLQCEDLMFARPATGIPSQDLSQVLGKRLTRPLALGELLTLDALED